MTVDSPGLLTRAGRRLVQRYLGGADRDELDPVLGIRVAAYVRTYRFLSCVLPYTNAESDTPSIFLNPLISKLPAPEEENLSKGILDAIDMNSYRVDSGWCSGSCWPTRAPR